MKKINLILGVFVALSIFLFSCDPREETKQPVACFDFFPIDDIGPGDEVTFTNCSENSETFDWNFGDGSANSVAKNPKHKFDESGEYDVTLIVQNKNLKDQITKTVTIDIRIDPTNYNAIPAWDDAYYNDFSTNDGEWWTGPGDDYELTIANGYYTMIDNNMAEDHYGYFITTEAYSLPNQNYDLEVVIRNTIDNGIYGSGLLYGANQDFRNYFRYTLGSYYIYHSDEQWLDWTDAHESWAEDWNLLTVRQYQNKYYFFINEVFEYETDYNAYGNTFGFIFDKYTMVDIDEVGVWIMNFSANKSGSTKQRINTPRKKNSGKVQPAPFAIKALK